MKKTLILLAAVSLCAVASAKGRSGGSHSHSHSGGHSSHSAVSHSSGSSHSVSGYIRKDGTYVAPSHATNPNGMKHDNWTTKGNMNPNTGKEGTREP